MIKILLDKIWIIKKNGNKSLKRCNQIKLKMEKRKIDCLCKINSLNLYEKLVVDVVFSVGSRNRPIQM